MSYCFLRVMAVRLTSCPSLYWVMVDEAEEAVEEVFCTSVAKRATRLARFVNILMIIK